VARGLGEDPRNFVAFTRGRVFISTTLGCRSRCSYCYIADFGYRGRVVVPMFGGADLRDFLLSHPGFAPGPQGDLLSLGCFGEPFDPAYAGGTLDSVSALAVLGNPMQIATKRQVTGQSAAALAGATLHSRQLTALISMSTLNDWERLEPGTASPSERLIGARHIAEQGLPVCLYIQPVVPGVTDLEVEGLSRVLRCGPFDCGVVGSLHTTPRIERRLQAVGLLGAETLQRKAGDRLRHFPVQGVDSLKEIMPRSALVPLATALSRAAGKPVFLSSHRTVRRATA
jgi:DNA repair photolyase